jgi:hypothetical protein
MLVSFFKFLIGLGVAYVLALACFILECTIGIKGRIKDFFKVYF